MHETKCRHVSIGNWHRLEGKSKYGNSPITKPTTYDACNLSGTPGTSHHDIRTGIGTGIWLQKFTASGKEQVHKQGQDPQSPAPLELVRSRHRSSGRRGLIAESGRESVRAAEPPYRYAVQSFRPARSSQHGQNSHERTNNGNDGSMLASRGRAALGAVHYSSRCLFMCA